MPLDVKNAKCQMFIKKRQGLALTEDLPQADSRICPEIMKSYLVVLDPWFCYPWIFVCICVAYVCLCTCVHMYVQLHMQVCMAMYVETRGQHPGSSSITLYLVLKTGSQAEPEALRLS